MNEKKRKRYLKILDELHGLILSEVFYNTEWDFEDLMEQEDLPLISQDDYLEVINYFIKKLKKGKGV